MSAFSDFPVEPHPFSVCTIAEPAKKIIGWGGWWCPRKACKQSKTCCYVHNCKAMTHADAKIAREKREAENKIREAEAEEREWRERNARQRRLLIVEQKLDALGLDIDELIELIEARQNGTY